MHNEQVARLSGRAQPDSRVQNNELRRKSRLRRLAGHKLIRAQIEIAPQHLPILVAGNERYLRDIEPGLKEAARRFMAQVMEVQILDAKFLTGATEGCPE